MIHCDSVAQEPGIMATETIDRKAVGADHSTIAKTWQHHNTMARQRDKSVVWRGGSWLAARNTQHKEVGAEPISSDAQGRHGSILYAGNVG